MEPAEADVRPERRRSGPTLDRALLLVIALGVTTGAVALVVTAWAAVRTADAQRDMACQAEASSQFVTFSVDFDSEPGEDDLRRQQDRVKRALEDCGVEFPQGQ